MESAKLNAFLLRVNGTTVSFHSTLTEAQDAARRQPYWTLMMIQSTGEVVHTWYFDRLLSDERERAETETAGWKSEVR